MWTIFKFVTILFLFYALFFWPRGMWDLSFLNRDQTCIPCVVRWILNNWTTREVPRPYILKGPYSWTEVCWRTNERQGYGWNGAGPCGALPCVLFVGIWLHSASLIFPEFQRADSNSCLSGKGENAETKEEQSRNNSAASKQGPGSSSGNTHNNIFEFFYRN